MTLSVVIATMDRPSYLDRLIASFNQNQVKPDEVVVVDDGRSPETVEVTAGWSDRWPVVLYVAAGGVGTSRARNLGAQSATGDLVLFTDDDCLVHEDCVGRIVEIFQADPEVQCVTGRLLPYGEAAGKVGLGLFTRSGRREWKGKAYPWEIGHSGNMCFRREAYLQIGGFDEEMGPGTKLYAAEDMDVLYRVLRAGAKIVYQPEAIIFHDHWRSRSESRRRRADYARGIAAFLSKHILVHRDGYALQMLLVRLWQDVPLLALIGLAKRNLELELVSLYQFWGLITGFWVAGRHYGRKRRAVNAPMSMRT